VSVRSHIVLSASMNAQIISRLRMRLIREYRASGVGLCRRKLGLDRTLQGRSQVEGAFAT
jgi:hypothetical protein